ncbi:MAG: PaaI family thioesterase [Pseudomonadota bacterium]
MDLKLTAEELADFLDEVFPQVRGEFAIETLKPGSAVVRLNVTDRHLRPGGTVSGPSIFSLADCAMYMAVLGVAGREALAVTTNCSIDFMRKPDAGRDLLAEARLLKFGRVLAVGDVMVRSEGSDAIVARASLTYSRPPAG